MANICHAFHLTPDEYRSLTLEDCAAFARLMNKLRSG